MPFVQNNVGPSFVRPESHTGRASALSARITAESASGARPESTNPTFVPSPADKLYSSPPPAYENFNTLNKSKESLELTIRQHRAGGLLLPLELSQETALMNIKRGEYEQNAEGGQLTALLRERRLERPVIGCVNEVDEVLSVEGQPVSFPKRPESQLAGRGDSLSYVTNNFKQSQEDADIGKRLKEASNLSLQNIKEARPLSSYGRELEKKILNTNVRIPVQPNDNFKPGEMPKKYALNDWIVKSRAGKATNKPLRGENEIELLEDNTKLRVREDTATERVPAIPKDPMRRNTHKDVVNSIITTVDDILPIFECIKERIELEKILKSNTLPSEEKIDRLKQLFKARNVHFNYAEEYEAELHGEAYYENLKAQYSELLKSSPDLIANTLLESEFVYLTYDTPETRRFLTIQYLRKNKGDQSSLEYMESVDESPYARPNPRQNCYELIVCAYDQVNPNEYFTISSAGITEFHDKSKQTSVMSMDEWTAERKTFMRVKDIRFFADFFKRKAMFIWKGEVKAIRKTRAYASINRLSLQANITFEKSMAEVCFIIKSIVYDLHVATYKLYSFENVSSYLIRVAKGNQKYMAPFYSHAERRIITLVDFVNDWNANLPAINSFLTHKVEELSEILLAVCRTVAEHIEARTLTADNGKGHGQEHSANAILSAISNATTFNMGKIKSLIKASDYNLSETLLEKLIEVNRYIINLFFGVPVPPEVLEEASEQGDELDYSDSMDSDDRQIMDKFNKHTLNERDYQKTLEQYPPTEYEHLLEFFSSFDNIEEIASEDVSPDLNLLYQVRFDRHNKRDMISGQQGAAEGSISRIIQPENLMAYYEYTMKEGVLQQIYEFPHEFVGVPLAAGFQRYPPYPLFHLQISIINGQFHAIPSQNDLIELLGDCLSEVATIFHRSIRPYSYPKLAAFLSETTRTSNLSEYIGISIKDSLAQSEDYICTVREIKQGVFDAYKLVDSYCRGFVRVFAEFEQLVTEFRYTAQSTAPKISSHRRSGVLSDNLIETVQVVLEMWRQRPSDFHEVLSEFAFPGLLDIDLLRETPEQEQSEDEDSLPISTNFDIPDWNYQFYDLFKAQATFPYAIVATLLQPAHFSLRSEELNNFFIEMQILKVRRAIMCFNVSTIELYEEFAPFMVYFEFFTRMTLPLSIMTMQDLLTHRAIQHSTVLEQIPKIPDDINTDFEIPAFTEYNQCIFDASALVVCNYDADDLDLDEIKAAFIEERRTVRAAVEARREKAEIQRKLFLETQALMEERVKSKGKRVRAETSESKQSDLVEESETTQSNEDNPENENAEVHDFAQRLEMYVDSIIQYTPWLQRISDPSQLPPTARELYNYLYETQVDRHLLDTVKLIIEVYETARGEVHIFRESERKAIELYDVGSELGILDEMGNLKLDELSASILHEVFRLDFDMTIKEAFKEFENEFQMLERNITNFTIKKPQLYEHFRFNLVVLYVQLGNKFLEVLSDMLKVKFDFNIYIDSLEHLQHRSVVYCGEVYNYNKGVHIEDEEQLFLYLLFEATDQALDNDNVKMTVLQFQHYAEELDELNQENEYFNRCLQLFDSLDFNVSSSVLKTEIVYVSQFCLFLSKIFTSYWAAVAKLQELIQTESCLPLVLLDIDEYRTVLSEIEAELQFIDDQIMLALVGFEDILKTIEYDEYDAIITSSISDDYDSLFNFTSLKFLVFSYKAHLKEAQLRYGSLVGKRIKNELEHIIEYERADNQGQEMEFKFSVAESPEIFHSVSVDDIQFTVIARDAISYYLQRSDERKLVRRLVEELKKPLQSLEIMRTIAFQPRHFEHICKLYIPTPDLSYETFLTRRILCKIPESKQIIPLADILSDDRENAYRKIFGMQGDGVVEILLYHIAVLPRREAIQKELTTFKFEDSSAFMWELRETYLDIIRRIPEFRGGKPISQYLYTIQQEENLCEELERQEIEANELKLCETDVEDAADEETITTKAEVFETTLSTIELHNDAAFERRVEILLRRKKEKHETHKEVHSQLEKGGFFIEMDRFTCTISKLVLRGLFAQSDSIRAIALNADAEYKLLDKLSGTRDLIMSLRFKMLSFSVDSLKISYISDPSKVIETLSDQLINLHSLNSQFRNLIKTDIAVAIKKLEELEEQSEETITTIKIMILTETTAMELMPVFSSQQSAICKALPEETRQFNRVFKLLANLMEEMFESNGLAVKNCTDEVAKLLSQKIEPEFELLQSQVERYLEQKRDNYSRFYFVSNKLLCQFLNLTFVEQSLGESVSTLNMALDQMFENIKQTDGSIEEDEDGEKRFIMKLIQSNEGETLEIVQLAARGESEAWIAVLQQKIENALNEQIARCFVELLYFSRESMGAYGYDSRGSSTKEQRVEVEQFNAKLANIASVYCAEVLCICLQAIILFYYENGPYFYELERFNLAKEPTKRQEEIRDDDKQVRIGKEPTEKEISNNLYTFYQRTCQGLLKLIRGTKNKIEHNKLQIVLLTTIEAAEAIDELREAEESLDKYYSFPTYYYNVSSHQLFCIDFAQSMQYFNSEESPLAAKLNYNYPSGQLYGLEYYGLQQRSILSERLVQENIFMEHHHLATHEPLIFSGQTGQGKSLQIESYSMYAGRYLTQIQCSRNAEFAEFELKLMGSCLNGSFLVFEDIDKLNMEIFSVVCIYLHEIEQGLENFNLQFSIGGENFKLLPTTSIFGTVSAWSMSHHVVSHFKTVETVVPDNELVIKKYLYVCGFYSYQELSSKLEYFCQLLTEQYIPTENQFSSFRVIKQYLIILNGTHQRWIRKFSESSRLSQYFASSKQSNYKHEIEEQNFFSFIEEYCAVYCIYKFFVPEFETKFQGQMLHELTSAIFGSEIVDMIEKDERVTKNLYTSSIKNSILRTTRAMISREKTLKHSGGFSLEEQHASDRELLFYELVLTKNVLMHDIATISCQNIFYGEAELMVSATDDTQLLDSNENYPESNVLSTRESLADLLQVSGRSNVVDTHQSEHSESDSMSGSGFQIMSHHGVGNEDEIFNTQVQGIVNTYVMKNQMQQINQFIRGLLKHGKLVDQNQLNQYEEFEGAMWYRTAIVIKGRQHSGKSTLWRMVLDNSNDYIEIYPSSLSEEELFGFVENGYFTDGVIPTFIRKVLAQEKEMNNPDNISTLNLKFIVFNGYSDNLMRLLSAIDDTRYLILENGEFLRIPNNIRMIFEVESTHKIPIQFKQRCITVGIEADHHVPFVYTWLRQTYSAEYNEYVQEYDFDMAESKIVKRPTLLGPPERYRKRSLEEVEEEKLAGLLSYGNAFLEVSEFVAFMFVQVREAIIHSQCESISYLKKVELLIDIYTSLLTPIENEATKLLMTKQVIFFAFYHAIESIVPTTHGLFDELYLVVFKPILEVLVVPERIIRISEMLFDPTGLIPQKIQDGVLVKFTGPRFKLLEDTELNPVVEGEISVLFYDVIRDKLIMQTVCERRLFAEAVICYGAMKSGTLEILSGNDAAYYNEVLFAEISEGWQKVRFGVNRDTTIMEFKSFFFSVFNSSGDRLLPLEEVPIVIHLFGIDEANDDIITFMQELLTSGVLFARDGPQMTERSVVGFRIVASANSSERFLSLEQSVIEQFPKHDVRSQREAITHAINVWSNDRFRASDEQVFPVFHHLQRFIVDVHQRMEAVAGYKFGKMLDFLRLLFKIDENTFTDDATAFYDQLFGPKFKRALFETVIHLMNETIFEGVMEPGIIKEVMERAIEESQMSQQVVELKIQASLRLPTKYHPDLFLAPNLFLVHFEAPELPQDVKVFNNCYPFKTAKFIECEFPSRYNELHSITERLPPDLPKIPDVVSSKPLLSYVDTQMIEIRRRILDFNYKLCNYRNIVAVDRPGYETRFLLLKLAMRYNYKFHTVGDKMDDNENIYNVFVISIQMVLCEILQELEQGQVEYCLFLVPDQYLRNTDVISFLCQLYQSGAEYSIFNVESSPLHLLVQLLRGFYDQSGVLSDLQLRQRAFDLLCSSVKIVLAPEIDTLGELGRLKEECCVEEVQMWSLDSICIVSLEEIPGEYIEMRKLCSNERIMNMFLQTFEEMVEALATTAQHYDVLLSPNFFTRFLCCYHSIYFTKRSELQRQKATYSKGLELFAESAQTLQKIEEELGVIKPKLELLQANTDLLLSELKTQKHEIESRTKEVKIEEKTLQLRAQQIEQELTEAQIELDEVMPILDKAEEALKEITRQEIAEIASFVNPKEQIVMVMSAICIVLGESASWQAARQLMSSGNLVTQLLMIKPLEIPPKQMKEFKQMLENEQFEVDKIQQVSLAASLLANWCISVVAYCDAYEHIEPRIDRLNAAKHDYEESVVELEKRKQEIIELTSTMKLVEQQLENAMEEKTEYEHQMRVLEEREGIVQQLNVLLDYEHAQWCVELSESEDELEKLSVLSLLAAIFTLMQFSNNYTKHEQSLTCFVLEQLGFNNIKGITTENVYSFIAGDHIQSVWKMHGFFGDKVIFRGMFAINNVVTSPYVVDPDLVFIGAAQSMQLLILNFEDPKWIETFVRAVSEPRTIILQLSNVFSLPNLVKTVMRACSFDLNRLFTDQTKYTRLTEMVVNDVRIDVNEHLQFVIVDNEAKSSSGIKPEILSQYQVISFIKDEQSLAEQISNVIIDAQNSDIEIERNEAIKNQAMQEIQLNSIETQIVQTLLVFDFTKDLDSSKSTIIPELQNAVTIKQQLIEKLKEIETQTEHLKELRIEQLSVAKYLSYLYLAILEYYPYYRLAHFTMYIRNFIATGMQSVVDNIMMSVEQKNQKFILFQVICELDQERSFNPVLVRACQEAIIHPDPLVIFNPDTELFSSSTYKIAEFASDESQLISFIRGRGEKAFDFMQRCCSVSYLLCGLFKQLKPSDTPQEEISRDSLFYTYFTKRISYPDNLPATSSDLCPELQYEIMFALQTKWKSHFLELFAQENINQVHLSEYQNILVPQFFAMIYHICNDIVQRTKDFNGEDSQELVVYLSILFTKLLKPDYFDTILAKFIDLNADDLLYFKKQATPDSILAYYVCNFTSNPLFISGPQVASLTLINGELDKYHGKPDDNKIKAQPPEILVTSLQISNPEQLLSALTNELEPHWLILVNFDLSNEEDLHNFYEFQELCQHHEKQIQTDCRVFLLGEDDINVSDFHTVHETRISSLPKMFIHSDITTEECSEHLAMLSSETTEKLGKIAEKVENQFLAFFVACQYGNFPIRISYNEFQYFKKFYVNLVLEESLEESYSNELFTSRISQLFGSSLSPIEVTHMHALMRYAESSGKRASASDPQTIGLPPHRIADYYRKMSQNNLIYGYTHKMQCASCVKAEIAEMPLNEFLLLEQLPFEQQIDLHRIKNVAEFFSILQLQAATIFGYSPSDYRIVFSAQPPVYNDVVLTGLNFRNTDRQITQLKVLAALHYKRRDLFLPILCAPRQEKGERARNLKISLPVSRFSEFSLGSIGEAEDQEIEVKAPEKPLKERRLGEYLMSECKICTEAVELRRSGQAIGSICVDFGQGDELELNGVYCEI